ncbi:MAG: TonB-dependent receptor [Pseudomonadota bacterium]
MIRHSITAAVVAAVPAFASAQAGEDNLVGEDIVVSGGRTPIAANAYGRAHSVVTAEEIERRQITEVSEALRSLPGVSVSRTGGPGGLTQVRIRGAEGNHVLVLIDGIEVSQAQSGEYDFAGLLTAGIERVEVLRGPQSALYGSNATAGVISITTKRGERNSFAANGVLEGGSNGTSLAQASMRGGGEDFDFSISAAFRRDGGFDVSDDPGGKGDEDRNITFNSAINVSVTEELMIGGTVRFTDRESDFDEFNFGAANPADLVTDANNSTEQREIFASLRAQLETFGGRVVHQAAVGYTDVASANFTDAVRSSDTESDRLKASYQATIALDSARVDSAAHTLTLATEWEREGFQNTNPALVFDASQLERQERELFGFVGEYRGSFFDALDLQLGVRYDVNDDFDNAFTYSAGASYLVNATGTRFHGSVGTGVTNPSFFEQFGFIPATFIGNPDLRPEENFSWDIGLEQTFWNDRIVLDVTYFQARLRDEIATVFDTTTFTSTPVNQNGISRRQGVEISADVEPVDGLTIGGSYTWLSASDPDGRIEVRRPRHEGGINVAYDFLGGAAVITADGRIVLGNFDSDFTSPSFGVARTSLDDYFLLDVAGSYQVNDMVKLTLRVENVTDTDYEEVDGFATRGITGFGGVRLTF